MFEQISHSLELLTRILQIAGAGALVLGFVIATVQCMWRSLQQGVIPAVALYRKALGRVILIGLEILVAATIIKTITIEPSVEGVLFLVFMVAIRTILGWAMVLEISGRWPWQQNPLT